MKLVIGLFVLALLGTAAASIGLAAWTGHLGHHDANLRAIHYDTNYDLSALAPHAGRIGAYSGGKSPCSQPSRICARNSAKRPCTIASRMPAIRSW